tara:strand:- start:2746 stop:3228 length:483 start_codon:yes stop_codon:yes gene_type:complete
MKLLKSKIHDIGYYEVVSNLEPKFKGQKYPIKQIAVDEIWASVPRADIHLGKPFYTPVREDIEKNGMHWPIMVVNCTRQELLGQKSKWGDKINDPPFWIGEDLAERMYVVWGGSNRLWIARDLGYTHIDAAVIPTFNVAHKLQKTMREDFPHYYGGHPER